MTDPVTHLLWGYVLARTLTPRPAYLLLGMSSAVLLDLGALLPGIEHHGWLHTPVFVLFVSLTLWGASRDRMMFLVPMLAMGSHLVLDSVGAGVMWLWPLSTQAHDQGRYRLLGSNQGFACHWSISQQCQGDAQHCS